jgi:hypothetical protein
MALGLKLEAKLAVVVDLAVEDKVDRTRRVGHGLVTEGGEVDDREACVAEGDAGCVIHKLAVIVGAAVRNAQEPLAQAGSALDRRDSDDSAHGVRTLTS